MRIIGKNKLSTNGLLWWEFWWTNCTDCTYCFLEIWVESQNHTVKQCLKATYLLLFQEESKDKFSHHILSLWTINYGTEMGAKFIIRYSF